MPDTPNIKKGKYKHVAKNNVVLKSDISDR